LALKYRNLPSLYPARELNKILTHGLQHRYLLAQLMGGFVTDLKNFSVCVFSLIYSGHPVACATGRVSHARQVEGDDPD
jgi:hypothetical protein